MSPTFYRMVPARVSYFEVWRGTRSLLEFTLAAIVKTLRIPLGGTLGYTNESFQRLDWEGLADDARASLGADRETWSALGLRYGFCYRYPRIGRHRETALVMRSEDGAVVLKVEHEKQLVGAVATVIKTTYLVTRLSQGQVLVTCSRGDVFPPEFQIKVLRGKSAEEMLQHHRRRIAAAQPAYPFTFHDDAQLEAEIVQQNRTVFDYAVRRGVLVPMTEEQRRRAEATSLPQDEVASPVATFQRVAVTQPVEAPLAESQTLQAYSSAHSWEAEPAQPALAADAELVEAPPASRHAGVLAEIDRLQNKKASWLSGALVLGVSIFLFVGLGGLNWDWKFVLLLIPILVFHELGHFLTMRIFRYRNVRMFFIPLFGAAVTGRHYNVPGWKKAIVSLAGPVPGIVVGGCLGMAALVLGDQALLLEAAALTVFLNAFNLLPLLPLDGGWVMHSLVFSRHYGLDVGFRLLAALALLASGFLGMRILAILGFFMLLGLPAAYRVARIAAQLRSSGLPKASEDGQTIPTETAERIIDSLDATFPTPLPNNLKAQYTLQVFENINARPPGVLATLALGGAYGTSFVAGLVLAMVFTAAQFADLNEMMRNAATAPTNLYECGSTEVWPEQAAANFPPAATVVATFADRERAVAAFQEARQLAPQGSRVTLYGHSVLVGLTEVDQETQNILTARFQNSGAGVALANAEEPVVLTLDCIAPTVEAAYALEQDTQTYFSLGYESFLIPPWDTRHEISEQAKRARQVIREFQEFNPYQDDRMTKLIEKQREVLRQGDAEAVRKFAETQSQLSRKIIEEHLEERRRSGDPLVRDLAKVYSRRPMPGPFAFGNEESDSSDPSANENQSPEKESTGDQSAAHPQYLAARRAWEMELGSRLGQLPLEGDKPQPSADLLSIRSGSVTRNGLSLRIWAEFPYPAQAAPALAEWLCRNGCVDVKYEFEPMGGEDTAYRTLKESR